MTINLPKFIPHTSDDVYERVGDCLWFIHQLNQLKASIVTEEDDDQFSSMVASYDRQLKGLLEHVPVSFTPIGSAVSELPASIVFQGSTGLEQVTEFVDHYAKLRIEQAAVMSAVRSGAFDAKDYHLNFIERDSMYYRQLVNVVMPTLVMEKMNG